MAILRKIDGSIIAQDESKTFLQLCEENKANLSEANLEVANLKGANLSDADLDYSVLFLGCKSFAPKTDKKQRIQIKFHWAMWVLNAEHPDQEELDMIEIGLDYLNQFHREDVKRITKEMINEARKRVIV